MTDTFTETFVDLGDGVLLEIHMANEITGLSTQELHTLSYVEFVTHHISIPVPLY